MQVEISQSHKMNASNVDALGIGLEIAFQLVVAKVGVVACFLHVQDVEELMTVMIASEIVIDMWMTDIMVVIMEIGTILTTEMIDMKAVIDILVTGLSIFAILMAASVLRRCFTTPDRRKEHWSN